MSITIACPVCGWREADPPHQKADRCSKCQAPLTPEAATPRELAWFAVQKPAARLRFVGHVGVACSIAVIGLLLLRIFNLPLNLGQAENVYGICLFAVLGPCWAAIVLIGARHLRRLEDYHAARVGSFMAALPFNLAWIMGLPVGISCWRLLRRPEIRRHFVVNAQALAEKNEPEV